MKSNISHQLNFQLPGRINSALTITQRFQMVGWCILLVYFITAFCGHFNFLLACLFNKNYFPLKSYLILFNDKQITNLKNILNSIYNLSGHKAEIHTHIPYKLIDDLFFIFISTALIVLFYIGYKIVQSNKITQGEIIKWAIAFSVLMTISIPSNSTDLFGYIARGAQQTIYNQNPYLETVAEIKDHSFNPIFCNFTWPNQPTTYGPVFIFITKVIVYLSNNDFFISMINFKLLNLTAYLFLVLLVLKLNQTKDLYLIAWNPFILTQGLWNCHNDLISAVFIFLGIYMLFRSKSNNKHFWSMFFLVLAIGIKYVSVLIIPIILFYFLQTKSNLKTSINLFLGLCSGLLLVLIFSVDYLIPFRHVSTHDLSKITSNIDLTHKSLIAMIFTLSKYTCSSLNVSCDLNKILFALKSSFYIAFISFYLWILFKKKTNLIFDIILVLFVFFAFTIAKFHSWYLLNLIVLVPLLVNNHGRFKTTLTLRKIIIVLSLAHTYTLTFLAQAKILNFISMTLFPILFVCIKKKK